MANRLRIGRAVAEVRQLRKMTQKRVAELTDLTTNYISLIENDERTPSLEVLYKFSQALDVPAGFLLFLGDDSKPSGKSLRALFSATKNAIRTAIAADN